MFLKAEVLTVLGLMTLGFSCHKHVISKAYIFRIAEDKVLFLSLCSASQSFYQVLCLFLTCSEDSPCSGMEHLLPRAQILLTADLSQVSVSQGTTCSSDFIFQVLVLRILELVGTDFEW